MIQLTSAKRATPSKPELIPEKHAASKDPRLLAFHSGCYDMDASTTDFNYENFDTDAEQLCEELKDADLTPGQAEVILRWHKRTKATIADSGCEQQSLSMAHIIGELIGAEDLEMHVNCLAIAAGLDQASALGSQNALAKRLKVTRAAISKWVTHYKDVMNLNSRFGWVRSARLSASVSQSGSLHWRRKQSKIASEQLPHWSAQGHRRREARAGIRTPHAIRNVFERTLRQVSQRQHCSTWNNRTRVAWLAELRPIAEFYSRLSSKNL